MKSFEELKNEISLVRYLGSEFGTMYFQPNVPREKKVIIRHLDTNLSVDLLPIYAQLHKEIKKWLDSKQNTKEYVFIPSLLEIGKDCIMRPFYVYDIAIDDYYDEDEPVEPPVQYEEMKSVLSNELGDFQNQQEEIIQRIIKKSLLEPTGKTYFNYRMNKFIIVEPKVSLEDLNDWKQLNG